MSGVDLTQAREALADHLLPRCNVNMPGGQDEDGPIPGCPCDRHIDHDGEHYAPEDGPTWEHLRDALARVDELEQARARDVAGIVAYLRKQADEVMAELRQQLPAEQTASLRGEWTAFTAAADAIERGDWHADPLPADPRDAEIARLTRERDGWRAKLNAADRVLAEVAVWSVTSKDGEPVAAILRRNLRGTG